MYMPASNDESPADDLNETIATYIRLAEFQSFQQRMSKSYNKKPCGPKCTAASPSTMLTSSMLTSPPKPAVHSPAIDSFVNYSHESSSSSLMIAEAGDDLELGDDVDETLDSVDFVDLNNNNNSVLTIGASHQASGRLTKTLPLAKPCRVEAVLERLLQALNEIKLQDIEEFLELSTHVLQLHLGHNLRVDYHLFKLLFSCIEPSFALDLFDRGLIASDDSPHIGCLYERNFLFSAIDLSLNAEHSYAFDVLMSLAVLIYKSRTTRVRRNLFVCLNRDFTSFVTSDIYDGTKKSVGVKCLLRSLILTGVLSLPGLNMFLGQHEPVDSSIDSDMESDSIAVFSSSEDNSDDEHHAPHQQQPRGPPAASNRKTVAQFLNHVPNTTSDLCAMLPLTLKNRCRIVIKNCMPDYSLKHARRLRVLPAELQEFVSFNDEAARVVKLAKKLKTMPSMTQ